MAKSKVLVVGGTGYIGRRIVKASLAQGHETYVLQRAEIGLDIDKQQMLLSFKKQGAHLVEGSFNDHKSLVEAVKQADVVICTMSGVHFRSHNISLQLKLVEAIKEAGNVKVISNIITSKRNQLLSSFLFFCSFFFWLFEGIIMYAKHKLPGVFAFLEKDKAKYPFWRRILLLLEMGGEKHAKYFLADSYTNLLFHFFCLLVYSIIFFYYPFSARKQSNLLH